MMMMMMMMMTMMMMMIDHDGDPKKLSILDGLRSFWMDSGTQFVSKIRDQLIVKIVYFLTLGYSGVRMVP